MTPTFLATVSKEVNKEPTFLATVSLLLDFRHKSPEVGRPDRGRCRRSVRTRCRRLTATDITDQSTAREAGPGPAVRGVR